MGAELGVLLVRAQRALASVDGVGRVHVYKWGDGGAHLHVFVVARPAAMMQLRGMYVTTWMHALPPCPPTSGRRCRTAWPRCWRPRPKTAASRSRRGR
jgi:hypothetical protein